jgi:hypothetical protein
LVADYFVRPVRDGDGWTFDRVGDLFDGLDKLTSDLRDVMSRPDEPEFRTRLTGCLRRLGGEIERIHDEVASGRYRCELEEEAKLFKLKNEISKMLERNGISSEQLDSSENFHVDRFVIQLYRLATTIERASVSHRTPPSMDEIAAKPEPAMEPEPNPGRALTEPERENPIPQEHRSRPMTLGEAGTYYGFSIKGRSAQKQMRAAIDEGKVRSFPLSRRSFIFDKSDFPAESQAQMGVDSPKYAPVRPRRSEDVRK